VRFVYLGWNVIEERHTSAGVSTKKNFVWGLDLSQSLDGAGGIGGLLAVVDESGSQLAFLYDANGNVGQLVDEQGAVQARYEYDAFGQVLVAAGAAANDNAYRYSTKMADVESGLVYYGYRFYDAGLGRWISRDPISEKGGANLLAFVGNDAGNAVDALGQKCVLTRAGGSRANVRCDACDSAVQVAEVAALDEREFQSWLRSEDGQGVPRTATERFSKARSFSVPNTVLAGVGKADFAIQQAIWTGLLGTQVLGATSALRDLGYRVDVSMLLTIDEVRAALRSPDTTGLVYFGHGPHLTLAPDNSMSPFGARKNLHHGLSFAHLYGCSTLGEGSDWADIVTTRGMLVGNTEEVPAYDVFRSLIQQSGTYRPGKP
jgi:RHS repeat-associated protein